MACLKFRVPGGKIGIISAYAPHAGYAFDSRQKSFEDLGSIYERTSVNKAKLIFGDLNSRLHKQLPGEEQHVGEYVFGDPSTTIKLSSNRDLFISYWQKHSWTEWVISTVVDRRRWRRIISCWKGVWRLLA